MPYRDNETRRRRERERRLEQGKPVKDRLPPPDVLRKAIRDAGSYRGAAFALGTSPSAVQYQAQLHGIPSPRSHTVVVVCVFCGLVNNSNDPRGRKVSISRYHLMRSSAQHKRVFRAGSMAICDDCLPRKVTPPRPYARRMP